MNDSRLTSWYEVQGLEQIASPALFFYRDRIIENSKRMIIAISGNAGRLRPHVKTHKSAEIIKLQMNQGITKFKLTFPIYLMDCLWFYFNQIL